MLKGIKPIIQPIINSNNISAAIKIIFSGKTAIKLTFVEAIAIIIVAGIFNLAPEKPPIPGTTKKNPAYLENNNINV